MHFKSRTSSYRRILSFLIIFLFTFNSIVVAAPLDTSSLRAISAKQSVIVPEGLQEELQVTLENKTSSSGEQKLTVFQKFMGKNPAIEAMIKSKGFTGTVTKVNIKDAIRFLDSVGDFDIYTYNDGKKSFDGQKREHRAWHRGRRSRAHRNVVRSRGRRNRRSRGERPCGWISFFTSIFSCEGFVFFLHTNRFFPD